ncbi:homocitrate synthase NifV [Halanaerobium saccharolyticum]|uniref:Homocitrate synthase NifV n=1 Tax=Halanaerobium saccharolyticum TaxID=43595 RepID=A0A4R7Z8Q3_9FIRM|nr:hypothetical protein [Halanaerobium saccharolyticum]RAK11786.1 homocitrate synthase NifV [Halanaerobium saccharolyticum]TDW07627.1 homocitrate synthase NifV [Halanaerobium saccharolyticum]TDX64548.1 homocitrate synthase NifV [Halanaerobium saccharolyticum]
MKKVKLIDITFRDFDLLDLSNSNLQRLKMIKMMGKMGLKEVEIGSPVLTDKIKFIEMTSGKDKIKEEIDLKFRSWNRPLISDLRKSLQAGVDLVVISISLKNLNFRSNKYNKTADKLLNDLKRSIHYAKTKGLEIIVEIQNASAVNLNQILEVTAFCKKLGVNRLSYQEAETVIEPLKFKKRIEDIIRTADIKLEVNCSNIFQTAAAASLAAYNAGASGICASINGFSKNLYSRTALEEIMMILKKLEVLDREYKTEKLFELSQLMAEHLNDFPADNKAIIGKGIFKHESGIHVDGILKNPTTYEAFSPAEVGLRREIIIGKHSGKKAVIAKYKEFGIDLSLKEAELKLKKIKRKSIKLKRALTETELKDI